MAADLVGDGGRAVHYWDGVRVLQVEDAWRAVSQRACECLASRDAAVGIEPLNCARYVGELGANLAVGVELGPVGHDQTLIRSDGAGSTEHGQGERPCGCADLADREVRAWNQ